MSENTLGLFKEKYHYVYSPSSVNRPKKTVLKALHKAETIIEKIHSPTKSKPQVEIPPRPPVVIFPPTKQLMWPVSLNGDSQIKSYRVFIPHEFPLYVISYDPNLPADHTSESVATDFGEFIKEVVQQPAIIMGISYGGSIAIPFAGMFPEWVEKLILMVCTYTVRGSGVELGNQLVQLAKEGKPFTLKRRIEGLYHRKILRKIFQLQVWRDWPELEETMNPLSTFINAYTHLLGSPESRKKYLSKITAPTLILGGTEDQFASVQDYRETRDLIPNATLVLYDGQTHTVPIEKVFDVSSVISKFIRTE